MYHKGSKGIKRYQEVSRDFKRYQEVSSYQGESRVLKVFRVYNMFGVSM